jgi:subtilisin family serine protease
VRIFFPILARMKNKKSISSLLLLLFIFAGFLVFSVQRQEAQHSPEPTCQTLVPNRPAEPFGTATHDEHPTPFRSKGKAVDDRGRPLYKQGELLIRFKKDVSIEEIEALHKRMGSTVLGKLPRLRVEKVKLRAGLSELEATRLYAASPIVDFVERHALRYPLKVPNDLFFTDQWALPRISAPGAWDFTCCEPGVVIAVIDTGVDYAHPDLAGNIWINQVELNGIENVDDDGNGLIDDIRGWDFADEDAYPLDVDGHGTHVAGVIAAVGNNAIGTAGVCWNAKLMALKVQADGSEDMETWAVIQAIQYAMDHGARIVNCSFGGNAYSEMEYAAFAELKDAGILVVCAAGNSAVDADVAEQKNYPSCYDHENILSVAASNQDDRLASFSNFGLISVDIAAPGVGVKSTLPASILRESRVIVHTDSGTTTYSAIAMEYAGITGEEGITAEAYDCGLGYPEDFPPEASGHIALIQRGEIYFSEKAANAKNAGALAAIIYNNRVDDLDDNFDANGGTLGEPGDWIPVVSIPQTDGEAIVALGTTVVTVVNQLATLSSAYGVLDGTSAAAPNLTGVAGLILSKTPNLDPLLVKAAILNSVDKVPALEGKIASGGRVNAFAALCSTNTLPTDLSFDNRLGLEDALIAFRIATRLGAETPICPVSIAPALDINANGAIGLEEALYILQDVAGHGR